MSAQAFAHIHQISFELLNPAQGSRAMHDLLVDNLKLAKRNLTKDLLSRLMFLGVGTNEVENYAQRVSRQNVRRGRNVRMVRDMMRNKLDDARFDERQVRRMFVR